MPTLPSGITAVRQRFIVRITRGGRKYQSATVKTLAEALRILEELESKAARHPRPAGLRLMRPKAKATAETRAQWDALPRDADRRSIRITNSGFAVFLERSGVKIYGGHFSGTDALARAMAERDRLDLLHPRVVARPQSPFREKKTC